MLTDQQPESKPMSANRKLWLGFGAALLVVLAYVGWVFYSRWHENSEINQEVKTEQAQKEQKQAADTVESLGGSEFKIISFYATPGLIHPGDEVTMCYGASNAKSVSIDPPVGKCVAVGEPLFPDQPEENHEIRFHRRRWQGNSENG